MTKEFTPATLFSNNPTLNTTALYKLVMNGSYKGQSIVNILYYKLGFDLLPGDFNWAGCDTLAASFRDGVWKPLTDPLKQCYPGDYELQNITVYPYDLDWIDLVSQPYVLPINETGSAGYGTDGPAICLNCSFLMSPVFGVPGFFPPKRSYVSIGPILSNFIEDDGTLTAGSETAFYTKLHRFCDTLVSLTPPATFDPIRVSTRYLLGVPVLRGYATISTIAVSPVVSFRASRKPEAG